MTSSCTRFTSSFLLLLLSLFSFACEWFATFTGNVILYFGGNSVLGEQYVEQGPKIFSEMAQYLAVNHNFLYDLTVGPWRHFGFGLGILFLLLAVCAFVKALRSN